MSTSPTVESTLPPAISYYTFKNFLLDYKGRRPPSRIDGTVLKHMGGTVRGQLIQALKYFDLLNSQGQTQESLVRLVTLEGEERAKELRQLIETHYPFIFGVDGFDLTIAPDSEFKERFEAKGLTGDSLRKVRAFFLNACADAGIPVSQYITQPKKRPPVKSAAKNTTPKEKRRIDTEIPTPHVSPPPDTKGRKLKQQNGNARVFSQAMLDLMTLYDDAATWSDVDQQAFLEINRRLEERLASGLKS